MDLAIVVYWLSLICLAIIFLGTQGRNGVAPVSGALLFASPALLWSVPTAAPWIVLGLVVGLVLSPYWLTVAANRQGVRQDYGSAWLLSSAAALLHPFDGLPAWSRYYRALLAEQRDRPEAAAAMLTRLAAQDTPAGLTAQAHLSRQAGDFTSLLRDPRLAATDPATVGVRLWVLGETGRLGEMVDLFAEQERLSEPLPAAMRALRLMHLLAFCGRPAKVAALHDAALGPRPAQRRHLWRATAQVAAGGAAAEAGRLTLANLASHSDAIVRRLAALRLARPPVCAADRLDVLREATLDRIEEALTAAAAPATPARRRRNTATLLLFAANLVVFALELFGGGSQDEETLYRLGELYVPDVVEHAAVWRLFTALFLHAGPIHLAANMFALLALGSFIEPMLGRIRFLLLYLGAGVGSNAAIVLLSRLGIIQTEVLVGASGAIMGLFGAVGAAAFRQWLTARSPQTFSRLVRIGFGLALQTAIDLTTPRVSVAAHLCGASIGFFLGCFLRFQWEGAASRPQPAAALPPKSPRTLMLYAIAGASVGASLLIAAYR